MEKRRKADLGNGYYQNPILAGDYPDPSVIRVGNDYYMTHSSFAFSRGLLIWHSRDLVNWQPVGNALEAYAGNVYAPEFVYYGGRYFIYYPAARTNWVVTSPAPEGPWSKPIDLHVGRIDPGHLADGDGNRYLYLSGGKMIRLSDDGLSATGEVEHVYDGWKFPEEWVVEGFALESPKLFYRNGYYYLTVAQGGTGGPATSHMAASLRSKSPWGPWESSPYNPIVHTDSRYETWWSKGHGTLIDTPEGDWWIVYHAYEKGYHTLGRQTLLEPVEWTEDGWFKIADGTQTDRPIRKPSGAAVPHGMALSDSFKGENLGLGWRFYGEQPNDRYTLIDGVLRLKGRGMNLGESGPLLCIPEDHAYRVEVELNIEAGAEGGLTLFYNHQCYCGIGLSEQGLTVYRRGQKNGVYPYEGTHVHLAIVNDEHEVSLYYRKDGEEWVKLEKGMEVSGYHHNTFGGFLSLRAGMYALGDEDTLFRDFRYTAL